MQQTAVYAASCTPTKRYPQCQCGELLSPYPHHGRNMKVHRVWNRQSTMLELRHRRNERKIFPYKLFLIQAHNRHGHVHGLQMEYTLSIPGPYCIGLQDFHVRPCIVPPTAPGTPLFSGQKRCRSDNTCTMVGQRRPIVGHRTWGLETCEAVH